MSITSRNPHGSGWLPLLPGPIDPSACGIPGNWCDRNTTQVVVVQKMFKMFNKSCKMICWVILFACLVCLQLNNDSQRQTCLTSNSWRQHGDTSQSMPMGGGDGVFCQVRKNVHEDRCQHRFNLLCHLYQIEVPGYFQIQNHTKYCKCVNIVKILMRYLITVNGITNQAGFPVFFCISHPIQKSQDSDEQRELVK